MGTGCDEGNYEQKDQEGDEGVAGAFALPRHSIAILIEIGFHNDHTELAALAHCGRGDYLSALDAGALCIIANLRSKQLSCMTVKNKARRWNVDKVKVLKKTYMKLNAQY